jgi:DNA-binding CsgD family transcriptional regulator
VAWPLIGREADLDRMTGLIESGKGVAILGPAGVGKSRLLSALANRAEDGVMTVHRTVASQSTRAIPFAPFVDLLPPGPTPDRLTMFRAARTALRDGGSVMLAVDDAHHLDDASLAFLLSALGDKSAVVALTVRTGEPVGADLVDLWAKGQLERTDLGNLERAEVGRLLDAALGSVSPDLEEELWRLAAGNPLILHELIEGGVGHTIHRDTEGTWVSNGSVATSPRLADLVRSRLQSLPETLREAMEAVAIGSPLPIDLAREAVGPELSELEERQLAATAGPAGSSWVTPAHPLYGEILAAHIGTARSSAALRRLVNAALRLPNLPDALQVATWQHESGEMISPELAMAGAREALIRHDPGVAEALLQDLDSEDDRTALLLGRALSYRQRFDEAEDLLEGRRPDDQELLAEIASIRGQNLGFGLGKIAEARKAFEEAASIVTDPDLRARLINERAMVSAIHGDFVDALEASDAVLANPATSLQSKATAYVTLSVALAMTCDCQRFDAVLEDALQVADTVRDVLPFAHDQIEIMQMSSYLNAGRLDEAIRMCQAGVTRGDRGNAMTTTWLSASGLAYELAGDLEAGTFAAADALGLFQEADPFGLEAQARGVLAALSGQRGDPQADAPLREFAVWGSGARLRLWVARGRAWAAAAQGDLESAARIAADGGRDGLEGEHFAWASFCFSDAVRFGYVGLVIEDLRSIDTSRGAYLISEIQHHAEATLDADPAALEASGERFAGFGALLLASEAYSRAATEYGRASEPTSAARCSALSMALERRCGDPSTPVLITRPALVTPREVDLCLDAATGLTSPQIAEQRFISVRTVDNHLGSVYRKLGLDGRAELADTFRSVVKTE